MKLACGLAAFAVLCGLCQSAIIIVGDVAFDTTAMAATINQQLDQCQSSIGILRHWSIKHQICN